VETAAEGIGAYGSENVTHEPERLEGLEADEGEVPPWRERFSSPEEMWEALRNEQHVRGRFANALGESRAEVEMLEKAVLLVGSWDHLRVRTQLDGEERFVRAHGIRAWGDVTAALRDASRVQVNAESTAA
jgi:hypothetical protein